MEDSAAGFNTPKRQKVDVEEQSSSRTAKNTKRKEEPVTKLTPKKSPSTSTPRKRTPKKSPSTCTSRKQTSKNSTPKKNESIVASPNTAQKIDLWLEAKLAAEEDAKIYAGRKIHPFFSMWKGEKKRKEQEPCSSSTKREVGVIASGPIHVFENVQDDASPIDWSRFTFLEKPPVADFGLESSNLSVLYSSVESLNFDNLPSALRPLNASISWNTMSCPDEVSMQSENMTEVSPASSDVLSNDQVKCPSKPEDAKMDLDLEVNEANTFSGYKDILTKSDTEPLNKFLQERMRSYYHSSGGKADGSLWTHKYKPTKAFEVCGNEEAINFLRDWLHLWHERRSQCRKDSFNRGRNMRRDDVSDHEYASKDINEDSLQNVLLITGPVGSGKSAGVYACAQEQGFEVLELNASDRRNGVVVKQYYGEAFKSHRIKSLFDHSLSPHKKTVKLLPTPALPNDIAAEDMDDGGIEPMSIDDEAHRLGGTSPRLHGKSKVFTCDDIHTLILVEDVDILFPEDRGCIAAIQHISETTKGPIILTSSSNNAGLPKSFARLHVSFSLPLPDELLCHMYMVCVTEGVTINPVLLKKFVQSCDGDIRKTIMHLQFWFQSKKYIQDRKVQKVNESLPFDLEACHQIVPKILPWNFPSELSEQIEKEVAKSLIIMEEDSCLQGLVEELDINERKNDLDVQCMETNYSEAKVYRNKRSLTDMGELKNQHNGISELSNCSGSPVTSPLQKSQNKLTVISSDISCLPGPISVAETAIQNEIKPMSELVSSGCQADPVEVSPNNEPAPFTFNLCKCLASLQQYSDSPANTEIPEFSLKAAMPNFRDENTGITTVCNVIDEFNHAGFKLKSNFVESSPPMEMNMIQNLWKKLRERGKDVGQHSNPEQPGVIQVVKLTSGLSNLISEADLLFRNHQQTKCGILEPPISLCDETTYNWYDEQMMMSTVAVHGFCFYAKQISDMGSKFGCNKEVDLASEMLACTTNLTALGNLSTQDQTKITNTNAEKKLEMNNPTTNDTKRKSLSNVVKSIIPARTSLTMKDLALNEYISSLRQISISEGFRISHGSGNMRKQRRGAQHYLSRVRGTMLSPEAISLLSEGDLYRKISSEYTAKMESNSA